MKGPFVKIKTSSESVYVNTDSITSIEETGAGSAIVITQDRTLYGVTEVNGVPCKSIDDTAKQLNDTYEEEDYQSMEEKPTDIVLQNVVMTQSNPLTLQGKIFFKKDNMSIDTIIDLFEATISGILEETPISVDVRTISSDNESLPVAVIKKTCYKTITEANFVIEGLEMKDKQDKNIFNVLSGLVEACLRYATKIKEANDLYEAIQNDFEMYKPDTSTKEEECN